MLEKPKADHLTKGPVMSTQRESRNGRIGNNHLESSVDPPTANNEEIFNLIHAVHEFDPPIMQEQPLRMPREYFDNLHRMQNAVPSARRRELSNAEVVMMYFRSFHNTLEDDLSSVEELLVRVIGYMGTILADVLQLCYPTFGGTRMNDQLHADFTAYKMELREQ